MLVAEALGQLFVGLGTRHVFGVIGSGNFAVTNALVAAGTEFIAARHEGGAIVMADAYARVSGRVAVCSVHQGPGLTNAMTGLAEAAKSRTPLVLVAADTSAAASQSNFRIAQDQLVTAVGAVAERLYSPETAVADATRAFRRAQVERRSVVLLMPLDVQAARCSPWPEGQLQFPSLSRARPAHDALRQAVDALARAERPLILAGRGAVLADAREPLEQLAEVRGALLATSAVANGLFTGNLWALGISGGFASPAAIELIAEADVVLGVGASLNMWTTRHGKLLHPRATIIQVDDELEAIGVHHRVDIGLIGDAAETTRALVEELRARAVPASAWRSAETAARLRGGSWHASPYENASSDTHIDPRTLSLALDDLLPKERTVAIDSGHFMGYPAMYLSVPDAHGFVFTQAFQAVGLGLASAIGAAVARPDRLTVAAVGDGGALMALPELETIARLGLRLLVVVYNDAAYGAEVHHFGPQGHALDLVRFPDTDFAALARAVGLEGITVRTGQDLQALELWLRSDSPHGCLVDAKVVPSVVAEWLEEAFRGH